jgi:hypothetical protein
MEREKKERRGEARKEKERKKKSLINCVSENVGQCI